MAFTRKGVAAILKDEELQAELAVCGLFVDAGPRGASARVKPRAVELPRPWFVPNSSVVHP